MDQNKFRENTVADGHSSNPADADRFVDVPGGRGTVDFAVIDAELSAASDLLPLPIRLVNGRQRNAGGYGIVHMLYHHGAGLATFDFFSVQDFVDDTASRFDAVYAGRDGRSLVVVQKGNDMPVSRLLVLELAQSGDHYSVVSGWVVSARRPINGTLIAERVEKDGVLVWERRAPHSKGPG